MVPVQCSLQHTSSNSFLGSSRFASQSAPARMAPPARRALHVQAGVQPDMMVAAATIAQATISTAFYTSVTGGLFGAGQALLQPGPKSAKSVLGEAAFSASGTMRVGALMGLASGTLYNIGIEGPTATMGGLALGLGLYAALVTASNKAK